jgi:hypothetical protein
MTAPTLNSVLAAAADLAEDQGTTDQAVEVLIRYFGCYPDAYDFLYRSLRATHLVLSSMGSPAEIAEAIRWIASRDNSMDVLARWTA